MLEGIADPTNIGAIFRSAAALGMDGVLVTPTCGDPLSRRAARVSMGTVFQIPWARIGESAASWPRPGLEELKALGFRTAALALTGQSVSIDDPRLGREERLALLLGTEGDGLAADTIARCDYTVRIPMGHRRGLPQRGRRQRRGLLAAAGGASLLTGTEQEKQDGAGTHLKWVPAPPFFNLRSSPSAPPGPPAPIRLNRLPRQVR